MVTAVTDSVITASLAPRKKSEMRGLKYWAEPDAVPMSWEAKIVKDWIDHPRQVLTYHVDRATEVIVNGMESKLTDLRVGDHIGVETRPDQTPANRRPFFIFVYRYAQP